MIRPERSSAMPSDDDIERMLRSVSDGLPVTPAEHAVVDRARKRSLIREGWIPPSKWWLLLTIDVLYAAFFMLIGALIW